MWTQKINVLKVAKRATFGRRYVKKNFPLRYLQEFTALGTAGGMYHFRDQIRAGNPTAFFVLNGDVCADFPLQQLHDFHMSKNKEAEVSVLQSY